MPWIAERAAGNEIRTFDVSLMKLKIDDLAFPFHCPQTGLSSWETSENLKSLPFRNSGGCRLKKSKTLFGNFRFVREKSYQMDTRNRLAGSMERNAQGRSGSPTASCSRGFAGIDRRHAVGVRATIDCPKIKRQGSKRPADCSCADLDRTGQSAVQPALFRTGFFQALCQPCRKPYQHLQADQGHQCELCEFSSPG